MKLMRPALETLDAASRPVADGQVGPAAAPAHSAIADFCSQSACDLPFAL
jgi:hypothetical protein